MLNSTLKWNPRVKFFTDYRDPTVFWFAVNEVEGRMTALQDRHPDLLREWFRNRLHAGYCRMVNPYNAGQHFLISLRREDVDGFVFWTKNLAPFTETLEEVHQRGFPFVVQYTINGYPRALESRVIDPDQSLEAFREATDHYGPDAVVWRYDPIVLSSVTDADFHRTNFARLAAGLSGSTRRSLVHRCTETRGTLKIRLTASTGNPSPEMKRGLLRDLVKIAAGRHPPGLHTARLARVRRTRGTLCGRAASGARRGKALHVQTEGDAGRLRLLRIKRHW